MQNNGAFLYTYLSVLWYKFIKKKLGFLDGCHIYEALVSLFPTCATVKNIGHSVQLLYQAFPLFSVNKHDGKQRQVGTVLMDMIPARVWERLVHPFVSPSVMLITMWLNASCVKSIHQSGFIKSYVQLPYLTTCCFL